MKKICFLIASFLIVSCATIIHGTRQDISFSSTPTGAKVFINQMDKGITPVVVNLKRNENYVIKIQLDGYLPYETNVVKKVDGWIAGNIIFGGLIGLIIDAASGGMYKLSPEQISSELKNTTVSVKDNIIYIGVVMHANSSWELVGYLQKK
jgi:hypothetical protein